MDCYNLDSLRLLARERHQQRLREADAERLKREIGSTARRRRRLRLTLDLALGADKRVRAQQLET